MSVNVKKLVLSASGSSSGNPYGELLTFTGNQNLYQATFDASANLYGWFSNSAAYYKFNAGTYTRAWGKDHVYSMERDRTDMVINHQGTLLMTTQTSAAYNGVSLYSINTSDGSLINVLQFNVNAQNYNPVRWGKCISLNPDPNGGDAMLFFNCTFDTGTTVHCYFDQSQTSVTNGERYISLSGNTTSEPMLDLVATGDALETRVLVGQTNAAVGINLWVAKIGKTNANYGNYYYNIRQSGGVQPSAGVNIAKNNTDSNNEYLVAGTVSNSSGNPSLFISTFNTSLDVNNFKVFSKVDSSTDLKTSSGFYLRCLCDEDGYGYIVTADLFSSPTSTIILKVKLSDLSIQWQYRVHHSTDDFYPTTNLVHTYNENQDLFFGSLKHGLIFSRDGLPTGTFGDLSVTETDLIEATEFSIDTKTSLSGTFSNLSNDTRSNATSITTLQDTTTVSASSATLE